MLEINNQEWQWKTLYSTFLFRFKSGFIIFVWMFKSRFARNNLHQQKWQNKTQPRTSCIQEKISKRRKLPFQIFTKPPGWRLTVISAVKPSVLLVITVCLIPVGWDTCELEGPPRYITGCWCRWFWPTVVTVIKLFMHCLGWPRQAFVTSRFHGVEFSCGQDLNWMKFSLRVETKNRGSD